jgi:hypothetical protein
MRYQRFLAWVSLICFVLGAAGALTGCFGTRLGAWDYARGLAILKPGIGTGIVALAAGIVWLCRALWMNDSTGGRIGAVGVAGALLLVGIPAHYMWRTYFEPPIHDVSTDIGNAPVFQTLLAWRKGAANPPAYEGSRTVRYQGETTTAAVAQKNAYPDIKPLERLAGTVSKDEFVKKYFWRSLNAVNALGWQVADYDLKTGRIEATASSFWFGTVSDIVVRVRPAGAIGVRVDIRAKSRIGKADGGRNAALVRTFIRKVKGS